MLHFTRITQSQNANLSPDAASMIGIANTSYTKEKINSFRSLPTGWHYGAGVPPTAAMIELAHDWHRKLIELGFNLTDASPGQDGEIMISAYQGEHEIEIILETDHTISLYYDRGDLPITALTRRGSLEIGEALEKLAREIWNTSDSFIKETSQLRKIDSIVWHSKIITGVHPLFSENVLTKKDQQYAIIYANITPAPLENLRYSGFSTRTKFQQAAG